MQSISEDPYIGLLEKDLKDYPPTLQAKHLAKYLGMSMGAAYKLLKSGRLPVVNVPGSKFILVPKSLFIEWYAACLRSNRLDEMDENGV